MTVYVDWGNGATLTVDHGGRQTLLTVSLDEKEKHSSYLGLRPEQVIRLILEALPPKAARAAIAAWGGSVRSAR